MPRKTGGARKTPKKQVGTRQAALELERQKKETAALLWTETAGRLDQCIREMRAGDYSSLVPFYSSLVPSSQTTTVIDRTWRDDLDLYSKDPDAYQAGFQE